MRGDAAILFHTFIHGESHAHVGLHSMGTSNIPQFFVIFFAAVSFIAAATVMVRRLSAGLRAALM